MKDDSTASTIPERKIKLPVKIPPLFDSTNELNHRLIPATRKMYEIISIREKSAKPIKLKNSSTVIKNIMTAKTVLKFFTIFFVPYLKQ